MITSWLMNAKTTGRNHDADTVTNTIVYRSVTIQKIQYQFVSTIYVSTDGSAIVRLLYLDLSRLTDHWFYVIYIFFKFLKKNTGVQQPIVFIQAALCR